MRVETHYAKSGAAAIADQVLGAGPVDVLYVPGWFFNPQVWADFLPIRRYMDRLGAFARLTVVEKRGFGMSDRLSPDELPTVQERVADIEAVTETEGLGKVAVLGTFEGATLALRWAAANPERVTSAVLIDSFARLDWPRSIFGRLHDGSDDPVDAARALWATFEDATAWQGSSPRTTRLPRPNNAGWCGGSGWWPIHRCSRGGCIWSGPGCPRPARRPRRAGAGDPPP